MEKVLLSGRVKAIGMYEPQNYLAALNIMSLASRGQQLFHKNVRLHGLLNIGTNNTHRLEQLLTTAVITPAVNQVE